MSVDSTPNSVDRSTLFGGIKSTLSTLMKEPSLIHGYDQDSITSVPGVAQLLGIGEDRIYDWIKLGWIKPEVYPGPRSHKYNLTRDNILQAILINEILKTNPLVESLSYQIVRSRLRARFLSHDNLLLIQQGLEEISSRIIKSIKRPLEIEGWES